MWTPTTPKKSMSPKSMVQNIRRVGKQFRPNRQEDAHEYLRQLLDCMHEEIMKANNVKTSDGKLAETSLISRVFGGYLRNELKCSKCTFSSKTYNHFQDLSLEITGGISSGQIIHFLSFSSAFIIRILRILSPRMFTKDKFTIFIIEMKILIDVMILFYLHINL